MTEQTADANTEAATRERIAEHMATWKSFPKTPKEAQKEIKIGQWKGTGIDPTWQVRAMTEVFGKIGEGWGWEADKPKTVESSKTGELFILVTVRVWTSGGICKDTDRPIRLYFGGFTGVSRLVAWYSTKKYFATDEQAGKKATTDALTKCFSHLGLSADIFMSKFEDSLYNEETAIVHDTPLELTEYWQGFIGESAGQFAKDNKTDIKGKIGHYLKALGEFQSWEEMQAYMFQDKCRELLRAAYEAYPGWWMDYESDESMFVLIQNQIDRCKEADPNAA